MKNIVCVNGNFIKQTEAKLSIFDRSILFSDSVYEVVAVWDQQFLDYHAHIQRLKNSLKKLHINFELNDNEFLINAKNLIGQNNFKYGILYIQVSRGNAARDFIIDDNSKPVLFMFVAEKSLEELQSLKKLCLQSFEDKRWGLCDIKTTQLLYASLTKTEATKSGKDDSLFVKNGFVTEASSANFYIINKQNQLITRQLDGSILPGITRALLLKIARNLNIEVIEQKFTLEDAQNAKEAFISSATSFVQAVVKLNDKIIGNGEFGTISKKLRENYFKEVPRI